MGLDGHRTLPALLLMLAVVVMLWVILSSAGMADDGSRLVINQVLSEEFPQLTTYVTVVDAAGRPLAGLTEQDFQLREDGTPVTSFAVSPAREEGLHLILAIDASGSMLGGTALRDAKEAAATFLGQLGGRDRASLYIFSESAELVADFTDDFDELEALVEGFQVTPLARTALYEVLYKSAEQMERLPPGRKAILIFTDGTDTVGGFSLKDGVEKAQGANTPVFTIGLLGGEFDPAPIRQMADSTGGFYLEAPTSEQLTGQFEIVRELLEQQYVIRHVSGVRPSSRLSELSVAVPARGGGATDRETFLPLPATPWVQFTSPADGEKVIGTVPLALEAAARETITAVTIAVEGTEIATLTDRPYRLDWDSAGVAAGSHVLSATAEDAVGRVGQAELRLEVEPALLVQLLSPAPGADVAGITEVRTDIRSARPLRQVMFLVDGTGVAALPAPPYSYRWDTSTLAPGSYVVSVLAEDEGGLRQTAEAQVTVLPVMTLAWVHPQATTTLTETVPLVVDAQGHFGVESVEFSVNGQLLGVVRQAPYRLDWPTLVLEPGEYRLSACANDVMGNQKCDEVKVELKRAAVGVGLFITLGVLVFVSAGVLAMVVRSRRTPRVAVAPPPPHPPIPVPPPPAEPQAPRSQEGDIPRARARTQEPPTQQIPSLRDSSRTATLADMPALGKQTLPTGYFVLRTSSGDDIATHRLTASTLTVGRSEENHIQVDDPMASRRHAAVKYDAGKNAYIWEDLSPTNASVINGEECVGAHLLSAGDQIMLGETLLVFHLGEPPV